MPPRRREVRLSDPAVADLVRLNEDDPRIAQLARSYLALLESGKLTGKPLEVMPRYGDLSDCRKIYFGLGSAPTHRIVYLEQDDGTIEIDEVVAIEARPEGYVYLLAANRLGRLPEESKPRFLDLHQQKISERSKRRTTRPKRPGSS